ncbi:hypothetical protein HC891_14660 [Candidatus Gracilibacteria bacterium]|nr:hypothetical protein [Candidatus Gracilibacteria bacterium]
MDDRLHKLYREQLSQYKSANAVLHDLAWTLAELEQQITALISDASEREQTDETHTRRLSDLQRWKTALEDSVLRQMLRADELAAQVASARAQLHNSTGAEK